MDEPYIPHKQLDSEKKFERRAALVSGRRGEYLQTQEWEIAHPIWAICAKYGDFMSRYMAGGEFIYIEAAQARRFLDIESGRSS